MSLDPPASRPPVSRLTPFWESFPPGHPDPQTPAAPGDDLVAQDDLPVRTRVEERRQPVKGENVKRWKEEIQTKWTCLFYQKWKDWNTKRLNESWFSWFKGLKLTTIVNEWMSQLNWILPEWVGKWKETPESHQRCDQTGRMPDSASPHWHTEKKILTVRWRRRLWQEVTGRSHWTIF